LILGRLLKSCGELAINPASVALPDKLEVAEKIKGTEPECRWIKAGGQGPAYAKAGAL